MISSEHHGRTMYVYIDAPAPQTTAPGVIAITTFTSNSVSPFRSLDKKQTPTIKGKDNNPWYRKESGKRW